MSETVESMRVSRPNYADVSHDAGVEVLRKRWDVAELKYDGIWGRAEISGRNVSVYSRNGQLKDQWQTPNALRGGATIHGEFMFGSAWAQKRTDLKGKLLVFDCTRVSSMDLSMYKLTRRREAAARIIDRLGCPRLAIVAQYPIEGIEEIWQSSVVDNGFEGLVLKNSRGPFGHGWGRIKRVFEVDYVCMGFNQSNAAKYKGRMVSSVKGGLYVQTGDTAIIRPICNVSGLTEQQRTDMYQHPDKFVGRVFTASGKGVFDSGGLRHPNFVRWHPDKEPEDCTIASVLGEDEGV